MEKWKNFVKWKNEMNILRKSKSLGNITDDAHSQHYKNICDVKIESANKAYKAKKSRGNVNKEIFRRYKVTLQLLHHSCRVFSPIYS